MSTTSLVNMYPSVSAMYMPLLERVEIRATSISASSFPMDTTCERGEWPNLKVLDINVDSKVIMMKISWTEGQRDRRAELPFETKLIFNFFFKDVSRLKMTELRLNFTKEAEEVAIPKMEHVVSSCPNLKKLTIVNWPGTNKSLLKVFSELQGLEEISMEYCKGLGNVAFVGLDTRSPVLFKLTKLKKLTLKGVDHMPKITDLLFSMVIRHLKLSHLTLTSDGPIKSVTSAGVLSLLDGQFAESIEKFSFHGWSLADVSIGEFKKLEAKFRSYKMI